MSVKQSETYRRAINAATSFLDRRLPDEVESEIKTARLFCSGLRELDVYAPTKVIIEEFLKERANGEKQHFESVSKGLASLISLKYLPTPPNHRIFATLFEYHVAWNQVLESLENVALNDEFLRKVSTNFAESINSVVSGNGMHVTNWKKILPQSTTLYSKVNLEISRLCCGDFVGIYVVRVRGSSSAPFHSHTFLDEHHFLPESINGIHQVGSRAARCTQSDIIYIKHGKIHAFRNDEAKDRSFVFISGCRKLGPWDFVQDINSHPEMSYPVETKLKAKVEDIGGCSLEDKIESLSSKSIRSGSAKFRLSPKDLALTHNAVIVSDSYEPRNKLQDLQVFVARGTGQLCVNDKLAELVTGDVFSLKSGISSVVKSKSGRKGLVLYEFALN